MTSIQIVLITLSLLIAVFGGNSFRAKLPSRLLAAFFFITATGLILFPTTTTVLAHALGVGRGADLFVVYRDPCRNPRRSHALCPDKTVGPKDYGADSR